IDFRQRQRIEDAYPRLRARSGGQDDTGPAAPLAGHRAQPHAALEVPIEAEEIALRLAGDTVNDAHLRTAGGLADDHVRLAALVSVASGHEDAAVVRRTEGIEIAQHRPRGSAEDPHQRVPGASPGDEVGTAVAINVGCSDAHAALERGVVGEK